MAWDAETTLQLIGVLLALLGIGIAYYNHQFIVAAVRWAYSKLPGVEAHHRPTNSLFVVKACILRPTKSDSEAKSTFELPKLQSLCWDDPDIEAGAATSAWAEEVRREVEKCCV